MFFEGILWRSYVSIIIKVRWTAFRILSLCIETPDVSETPYKDENNLRNSRSDVYVYRRLLAVIKQITEIDNI